jgi:hypothetical protein
MANHNCRLLYHFGLSFNSDVVVGPKSKFAGGEGDKDYNKPFPYDGIQEPSHPLFKDVHTIVMRNACSVHVEPGAVPLLLVRPNQIRELKPEAARYSEEEGFPVLAAATQRFREAYEDSNRVVAALASQDLTRKGAVLAIGTWDFQTDGRRSDNEQFITNVWCWLAKTLL